MNNNTILQANLEILGRFNPQLAQQIGSSLKNISIDEDLIIVEIDRNKFSFSCERIQSDFDNFQLKPSKISFLRTYNRKGSPDLEELTSELFDKHNNSLVEALPNLSIPRRAEEGLFSPSHSNDTSVNILRDYMFLGSLNFIPFSKLLLEDAKKIGEISSVTLVESSLPSLVATLSQVSLQSIQDHCINSKIGFQLIFNDEYIVLQEQVFFHFINSLPCSVNGIYIVTGSQNDPTLIRIKGWLYGDTGFHYRFFTALGTSADELNQLREALLNSLSRDTHYLQSIDPPEDSPVLIVASGPSLDDDINWIRDNQDYLFIIAAGSAVGSLLNNNIRVDICVQLERGTGVYDDMKALEATHPHISDTCLVSSTTSDPNLNRIFKNRLFFHRPLATASCLFENPQQHTLPHAGPEAANAALEVAATLGFKKYILSGCDFASRDLSSHRASNAAGISPRRMNTPVRGSLNKTVYTDHTLSLVRDVFENSIRLMPGMSFMRLGEGLPIANTINVSTTDLDQLLLDKSNLAANFSAKLSSIPPSNNIIETDLFIEKLIDACVEYFNDLNNCLASETFWSIAMHRSFALFLNIGSEETHTRYQLIVLRYMRQLLFSALQPLYHSDSSEVFEKEKSLFIESIKYALNYLVGTVKGVFAYHDEFHISGSRDSLIDMSKVYSSIVNEVSSDYIKFT